MKRSILFTIVFSAVFLLLVSCSGGECRHLKIDTSTVSPDCDTAGYTENVCADCGFSYKSDIVAPTGHTLTANEVPPTCESAGYTEYVCDCGFSYRSDYLSSLGHTLSSKKIEPTCKSEGYTEYACDCGFSYRAEQTPPLPHALKATKTEPTCAEAGFTRYACECGYTYDSDAVPPTGHTFSTEKREPTCTELGYTEYSCTACDEAYTSDYVSPTGHSFSETVYRPTYLKNGYTKYKCGCGFEYIGSYVISSEVYTGAYLESATALAKGVDVSKWNGKVDFAELKRLGISFVILKAGSTISGVDPMFEENYKAARAAGLDVGAYFYTYSTTLSGAIADADACIRMLEGKKFEYPIYFDLEDPSQEGLGKELLTSMCEAFIGRMQEKGWFCGIYINQDWLSNRLQTDRITAYFDIWYARWTVSGEPNWLDTFGQKTGLWQYTDSGTLGSHECKFDMNVAYKDYPEIMKKYKLNGFN